MKDADIVIANEFSILIRHCERQRSNPVRTLANALHWIASLALAMTGRT